MALPDNISVLRLYFQRLRKPLELEEKTRCNNSAISGSGGLEVYVQNWAKSAPLSVIGVANQVEKLFVGYNDFTADERLQKVRKGIELCKAQEESFPTEATELKKNNFAQKIPKYTQNDEEIIPTYAVKQVAVQSFLENATLSEILFTELKTMYPRAFWHQKLFEKFGIETVRDLLYHFPRESGLLSSVKDAILGEKILFIGTVVERKYKSIVRKKSQSKSALYEYILTVTDDNGDTAEVVSISTKSPFDGYSPTKMQFNISSKVMVYAKVETHTKFQYLDIYSITKTEEDMLHQLKIVPRYPLTEGVYQSQLRRTIFALLNRLQQEPEFDILPQSVLNEYEICPFVKAISTLHQPSNEILHKNANDRVVFDEFLPHQLRLAHKKQQRKGIKGISIVLPQEYDFDEILHKLFDFELTESQKNAINEIIEDLKGGAPLNRLLEGDVGSGKTAVIIAALAYTTLSGYQCAVMAPTEVLAEQLFEKISNALLKFNITSVLLTGSVPQTQKGDIKSKVKKDEIAVLIGTHALIQDDVAFSNLGFVVIDEEHRFGVNQRDKLRLKEDSSGNMNYVIMTATPIPRTLAIANYGDHDISMLLDMPKGRHAVKTDWFSNDKLNEVYDIIENELESGHQGYVVCSLIEQSELLEAESAKDTYSVVKERFNGYRVELLHGRVEPELRNRIMEEFRRGEIDLLVATTIIEVGVDVANATVMAIFNADRFGLSQLHQLRGRVGRGAFLSRCLLITAPKNNPNLSSTSPDVPIARKRLKAVIEINNGFELARLDLLLRGHGEIEGTKQSGDMEYRFANLLTHEELLLKVQECAENIISKDHDLSHKEHKLLQDILLREKIEI